MRAVVCTEVGSLDGLVLQDVPLPDPAHGEVRVAVRAAGVTYVDALVATGRYQFPASPPYVPGGEAAGIVDALGTGVDGWQIGDRVIVAPGTGAFAEAVVARADEVIRIPDGVDFPSAATFRQAYATAWFAFTRRIRLRSGDSVLVTGAGGGVGLAAIDVAVALGAKAIGVASSEEKRSLARQAGAVATIDPTTEDVKVRARELTGDGVDVVYDATGGDVSEAALRALRFDGRLCVVGFPAGIPRVPLNLVLLNNRSVVGVEWGGWLKRFPDDNRVMVEEVVEALAAGRIHPVAPDVRPLESVVTTLADLLERRVAGKVAIDPT